MDVILVLVEEARHEVLRLPRPQLRVRCRGLNKFFFISATFFIQFGSGEAFQLPCVDRKWISSCWRDLTLAVVGAGSVKGGAARFLNLF